MKRHLSWVWLVIAIFAWACDDSVPANEYEVPDGVTIASIDLVVMPEQATYAVGDTMTFSWTIYDTDGGSIEGVPVNLEVPAEGLVPTGDTPNTYQAAILGNFTVQARLAPPYDRFSDSVEIRVSRKAAEGTPVIIVERPARGETVVRGGVPLTIVGRTENTQTLTIDGVDVPLDANGGFAHVYPAVWGVNMPELIANNGPDLSARATPTFIFAEAYRSFVDTNAEGVKVNDGLQILLGDTFFDDGVHDPNNIDDMATILEVILSELDVATLLQETGFLDDLQVMRNLGSVAGFDVVMNVDATVVPPTSVGATRVTLDSVDGGLNFEVLIGNEEEQAFNMSIDLVLDFDFVDGQGNAIGTARSTVTASVAVHRTVVAGLLRIAKEPGAMATASIENVTIELQDIEVDPIEDIELSIIALGGIPLATFNLSDLVNLDDLMNSIIDPIINEISDFVLSIIEPVLENFGGDVLVAVLEELVIDDSLDLDSPFDPNRPPVRIDYYTDVSLIRFTEPGAEMGLAMGFYSARGTERENLGSILRTDCLQMQSADLNYDWRHEMALALRTDALNGLLYSVWYSGFLTGPIDLSSALGDTDFLSGTDFSVELDPFAQPVLNGCVESDGVNLRMGDVQMVLEGELLGIQLDSTILVDLDLEARFETEEDGFYFNIAAVNSFDVEVMEVGPNADPDEVKPFLEDQLGLIIGALIAGRGVGPIELPSIDLSEEIEGVPEGSILELVPAGVRTVNGHVLVEGNLE